MQRPDFDAILGCKYAHFARVGSRATCNPPPTDTDEDWLVLIGGDVSDEMVAAGFTQDGSPEFYTGNDAGQFSSWRKGDVNIITTPTFEFYERFITATELARRFNLLHKADRIALFQAILYQVPAWNLEAEPFVDRESRLQ